MSWQASPRLSQRRHWNLNDIGVSPDHEPVEVESVIHWRAWPEILGGSVFEGGWGECLAAPLPVTRAAAMIARTSARVSRLTDGVLPAVPRPDAAHLQRL